MKSKDYLTKQVINECGNEMLEDMMKCNERKLLYFSLKMKSNFEVTQFFSSDILISSATVVIKLPI